MSLSSLLTWHMWSSTLRKSPRLKKKKNQKNTEKLSLSSLLLPSVNLTASFPHSEPFSIILGVTVKKTSAVGCPPSYSKYDRREDFYQGIQHARMSQGQNSSNQIPYTIPVGENNAMWSPILLTVHPASRLSRVSGHGNQNPWTVIQSPRSQEVEGSQSLAADRMGTKEMKHKKIRTKGKRRKNGKKVIPLSWGN